MLYQQMLMDRRSLQIEITNDVTVEYHDPQSVDVGSDTRLLDSDEHIRVVFDNALSSLRHHAAPVRELPRLDTSCSIGSQVPHDV